MRVVSNLQRDFWTDLPDHLLEGSLWLRIGFIALCGVASALVVLAEGNVAAWKAAGWALVAAAASYLAFRRACILIDSTEESVAERSAPRARAAVAHFATY